MEDSSPWQASWSSRLASRPIPQVELGVSHIYFSKYSDNDKQSWLWRDVLNKQQDSGYETTLDLRLSLFDKAAIQPGIYGQYRVSDDVDQQGAYLLGIDGQMMLSNTQLRLVLEHRNNPLSDNQDLNNMLNGLDKLANGQIYLLNKLSDQTSFGGYLQLANNHQVSLFYHQEKHQERHRRVASEYRLPLFKGLLSLSVFASDADWQQDKLQLATSWDYRF